MDSLGDVYLVCLPFPTFVNVSRAVAFRAILAHEFGPHIINRLAEPILSRSEAGKKKCVEQKQQALSLAMDVRTAREQQWPLVVQPKIVLERLHAYLDGSMWSDPSVCAVCSQFESDGVDVSLSADLSGLNLELLHLTDEYLIQKCVVQGMSSCFTFGSDIIDGLILDAAGVLHQDSIPVGFHICSHCQSALTHNRIPSLALANGLYCGCLPDQFRDLTWVEEKVCAIYCITAHVTHLFQLTDPSQPKVFHGNMCAHDMNVMSTAIVLPRTPSNINGFISVVFIGLDKFNPKRMGSLFRVHKQKIWVFLIWLKSHNCLYADIPLDSSIMNLYPIDGVLPGLHSRVVEDHELNTEFIFNTETAGFAPHPANLLSQTDAPSAPDTDIVSMVEKMGVSDPESVNLSGRQFTASALCNLMPNSNASPCPDLVLHHSDNAIPEYNNTRLFPGMYPTLYPYRVGGFEDNSCHSTLAFEYQAKYSQLFFPLS
jgi:hypothetical protein